MGASLVSHVPCSSASSASQLLVAADFSYEIRYVFQALLTPHPIKLLQNLASEQALMQIKQVTFTGRRDDMPRRSPMAFRLAADLHPSADGSAVRTSLVAGQLQAASVPIA